MISEVVKLPRLYFGQLLVTAFAGKTPAGEKIYQCKCSCGNEVKRTFGELQIKKLLRCEQCHAVLVEQKVSDKQNERAKKANRKQEREFKLCLQ